MSKAAGVSSFGLSPQSAKGTAKTAGYNWMKAHEVSLAIIQDVRALDPEIGGSLLRDTAFKAGVRVGGGARLTPRADDLGWLLYALTGSVATTSGSGTSYFHEFTMASDESSIPWASLRKSVSETWGETYRDCKLASARINIPAAGALTMDTGWLGIYPELLDSNPSWSESYSTEPIFITCEGRTELPDGTEINATAVTIDFANDISDDEERIVGSYYLDDPLVLGRMCTITWVHKIVDADLYQQIYMGGTTGTTWSSDPYITSVDLAIFSDSATDCGGSGDPYKLQFTAPSVLWAMDPVALRGNDIIIVRLTGSVLYSSSGSFEFELFNEESAYSWA